MPQPDTRPLHTQNPTERFSNRAADYASYRPSYPIEAIAAALADLEPPEPLTAADVGAGTGISARLLADQGAKVWAIEPNAAMREVALPHAGVEFRDGTAEQTGLQVRSVHLVLCAQSFHWFDKPAALAEFHRILKPGGRVALMWNDRNLEDEFTRQHDDIIRRVADRQIYDREDRKSADALAASPLFSHYRKLTFLHDHRLNQAGLVGLALSSSYIPKQGAACEQLILDLQALYNRWTHQTGRDDIALSYQTNLYLAEVSSVHMDLI